MIHVSAIDADSNPALQFDLIDDKSSRMKFAINQHTGVISVVEPLDFEETAVYKLGIMVSDSVHQTEAELTVYVLDINDNPPVFTQDFYQVRKQQTDNCVRGQGVGVHIHLCVKIVFDRPWEGMSLQSRLYKLLFSEIPALS